MPPGRGDGSPPRYPVAASHSGARDPPAEVHRRFYPAALFGRQPVHDIPRTSTTCGEPLASRPAADRTKRTQLTEGRGDCIPARDPEADSLLTLSGTPLTEGRGGCDAAHDPEADGLVTLSGT